MDAMASSDSEEYYDTDDDDMSQLDDGSDDGEDYDSSQEADDEACPKPEEREKEYDFETEADVRQRQEEDTAKISELLSVPRGFAAVLLRHCRWDAERLENEWFCDERRVREAVGLTAESGAPTALSDRPLACAICFDLYGPGETISAGCSHYYCRECWAGYVGAAVGDGARCLLLRCPDPGCAAPVARELVEQVAGDEVRARYERFVVRSYVEEGRSKCIRWCPGPGCTLAVQSRPGFRLYEVACACKHAFCFRCGDEAHRPASCETVREWAAKNLSDRETSNWVLVNTKHCPECRRAIEKNQGCNHMTCGDPCRHEFCWICLGPWKDHSGGYYNCNRYPQDRADESSEEKTRREQAKASLERYLHYYQRWSAHGASLKKARQELDGLEKGGLDRLAEEIGGGEVVNSTELEFLKEAYAQIITARRVLRWTYAYVYYLDPEHDRLRCFCEYLQGEAEASVERLHRCAEQERSELEAFVSTAEAAAEKLEEYREKLCSLILVSRNHFTNLVEGFESGMPEVS
ncbi:hypothetical protein BS78_02G271100 [Paspalum vaginatum]|nr:hypothetical protein BS78_02G271100 [Paspalum vaginatum]